MRTISSLIVSLFLSVIIASTSALHYFQIARVVRAHHHYHHNTTIGSIRNSEEEEKEISRHKSSSHENEQQEKDLEGSFLFISKRFYQQIPDDYTKDFMLKSLKLAEPVEVTMADLAHHRLEEGPAVPSMAIPDDNNDHITLKHMLLFETVQGSQDLLHDLTQLSDCYNPSVATYTPPVRSGSGSAGAGSGPRIRFLLACRSHGNLHGPMTLAWLDPAVSFQVDPATAFMGIGPGKTQVDYVDGEDYRLFDPQDGSGRLVVTYTFYPDNRFAQMRMATLVPSSGDDNLTQATKFATQSDYVLIPSAKQQELVRARERAHGLPEQDYLKLHQKNWCPLLVPKSFNNHSSTSSSSSSSSSSSLPVVQLIKYIHPLEVVQITPLQNGRAEYEELQISLPDYSPSHPDPIPQPTFEWEYGELRGGTAAHLVRPDLYLAFFHTKYKLPASRLISYFFGAYTFDAQPPHNLKTMSRFPLAHRSFYDGPWSTVYRNMIDYIVFPMSYIILPANLTDPQSQKPFDPWSCEDDDRCLQDTQLLLSVGVQDHDGWLARISLGRLLDSLVPVNDSESHHHRHGSHHDSRRHYRT